MPSFGGEVKPSVPCRIFVACKRSLNAVEKKASFRQTYGHHSRPQFHLSLLGALLGTWRHLAAKVGMSKGRGKQWQTTPKNLPRNAACQSHTGRLTGLWFLLKLVQGLNNNSNKMCVVRAVFISFLLIWFQVMKLLTLQLKRKWMCYLLTHSME
jgi:hypothetical protein